MRLVGSVVPPCYNGITRPEDRVSLGSDPSAEAGG